MKLLFVSTSLQCHFETFDESEFTASELQEYLANLFDIHINGVCYRPLKPDYFIWLFQQIEKVETLYRDKKIPESVYNEAIAEWEVVYQYAFETLDSGLISQAIQDCAINAQNSILYKPPIYEPKLETSPVKSNANAKQSIIWIESNKPCPNCKVKLSERKSNLDTITYNCFACNYYCECIPERLVDRFEYIKPYAEITWDSNGNKKTTFSSSLSAADREAGEDSPKTPSFSRQASVSEPSAFLEENGEGSELSDLSNLPWPNIVSILNSLSTNEVLKHNHHELYFKVIGYLGFQDRKDPNNPNIGKSQARVEFLESVNNLVKELDKLGYCDDLQSILDRKQQETIV